MQATRGGIFQAGRAFPLQSRAGGNFTEWLRRVREATDDPLSEAGESMKWFYGACAREGRVDRLFNCLLGIEKSLQLELDRAKAELERERSRALAAENEVRFVRRVLDSRDRQFSALQAEVLAARRDWMWRAVRKARCALRRARSSLGLAPREPGHLAGDSR